MMKFENIAAFSEYTNSRPPKHDWIDIGEYPADFLHESPAVYPQFYRISIKYGLETDKESAYMYFSSPNHPIQWSTDSPWKGYYINITEELISNHQHLAYSFLNYGLHEPLFLEKGEGITITELFKKALEAYNKPNPAIPLLVAYCNLVFAHVAAFYNRQFSDRKERYSRLVDGFFNLLNAYYDNPKHKEIEQPSVQYFARELHVTPNYLSDLIRFYTGKSALGHIHQHIIATAKASIQKKEATITEIAYQLGFEYPSYFTRLFRKHTGHTPSEYQNK